MAYYSLRADFFVFPDGRVTKRVARPAPGALQRRIYERDRYTCQICRQEVRRGGSFDTPFDNGPRAGSIDHILPVSRGGDHSERNLRVLCKSCNCSRKAAI